MPAFTSQPAGPLVHLHHRGPPDRLEIHRIDLENATSRKLLDLEPRGLSGIRDLHVFPDGQMLWNTARQIHLVRDVLGWNGRRPDASLRLRQKAIPMEFLHWNGHPWFRSVKVKRRRTLGCRWTNLPEAWHRFDPHLETITLDLGNTLHCRVGRDLVLVDERILTGSSSAGEFPAAPSCALETIDRQRWNPDPPALPGWEEIHQAGSLLLGADGWRVQSGDIGSAHGKIAHDQLLVTCTAPEDACPGMRRRLCRFPGSLHNAHLEPGTLFWREGRSLLRLELEPFLDPGRSEIRPHLARLPRKASVHFCGQGIALQKAEGLEVFRLEELDWREEALLAFPLLEGTSA